MTPFPRAGGFGHLVTDRELDVMAVLWDRGSGTVTEVREGLEDDLAYNTVLTILRTIDGCESCSTND